jgi:phosphoenolpyruvate synthase/pyruvate phosphate dikinase
VESQSGIGSNLKNQFTIPLHNKESLDLNLVGSKTKNLSTALNNSFKVPEGFCVTTRAYKQFIIQNQIYNTIDMEILRKPIEDMRWEEIWDASLRIRSAFLKAEIPLEIKSSIIQSIKGFEPEQKFAVRSSSPAEDSENNSFAGIHESYINVSGIDNILESVKLVWTSLWSDRAILYREELSLDSMKSSIAVLIQKMEKQPVSGLAFSIEPSGSQKNHMAIEAIGGFLNKLVDNVNEPEKWFIERDTHEITSNIIPAESKDSILSESETDVIVSKILKLEEIFKFPVDVEWTGKKENFTVLQVRPITNLKDTNNERQWYLTLTPNFKKLKKLADKVELELIPELEREGIRLSNEAPNTFSKSELAEKLRERAEIYFKWKKIYWDKFIPFAHGIRNFGTYYNDLVKPDDPYEFIQLLKNQDMLASKRNIIFNNLSDLLKDSDELNQKINTIFKGGLKQKELIDKLFQIADEGTVEKKFVDTFMEFMNNYMDVSYENKSLKNYPEILLKNIYELSLKNEFTTSEAIKANKYLEKLYINADSSRRGEIDEVLRIGRLSWKLRDDDNILLGKIESQFLIFLKQASDILVQEGKLDSSQNPVLDDWEIIYNGLCDNEKVKIRLNRKEGFKETFRKPLNFKPRQLVGQPSSPGIVTGVARIIRSLDDFSSLKSGEIIVCDAVQPQMTFLITIASGIIERRGGMLVHSSIIARELGIPSVNGVKNATELIKNNDLVTVNGYLGLVVLGEAEFDIENERVITTG